MKSLFLILTTAVTLFISSAASAEWHSRSHRSHDNVVELVEYAAHVYNDSRHNRGQIYYENRSYRQPHYDEHYDSRYNRRHRTYSYDRHSYRDRHHDRHYYRHHDRHHNRHH
jgi:hypothetical protein